MNSSNDNIPGDLLLGAKAIGDYLGITARQTYRLTYDGLLPHFKLGGTVSARRSALMKWLDQRGTVAA